MKLTDQEKAAQKAAFRAMSPAKKLDHLYTYYKWPILLALAVLIVLGSVLSRELTRKEPVLYLALVNVSVGPDTEDALTDGFLSAIQADARRREVYLYRDLYLSDDADVLNHEYAYASRMKLMGAVQAQKLDLVVMNREGYDLLSRQGYLTDLSAPAGGDGQVWPQQIAALLTENEVILSDNSLEVMLGEADEEERVTRSVANALSVSSLPLFRDAGFDGELYLGVIANSTRTEAAARFLEYLLP